MLLFPITSFSNLLESILLILNAMAILNEYHFLRKCKHSSPYVSDGWHQLNMNSTARAGTATYFKNSLIFWFYSMRNFGRCKLSV